MPLFIHVNQIIIFFQVFHCLTKRLKTPDILHSGYSLISSVLYNNIYTRFLILVFCRRRWKKMKRKRKKKQNQNLKKLSMYYFNLWSYQKKKKKFCFTEKNLRFVCTPLPLIFCQFSFQLGWGVFLNNHHLCTFARKCPISTTMIL